ncbi:MAG: class I SAM-dependent methyltransferase [Actinomycetota bacterium]|nr:methyltransferase domain-containing protein [Actinomycetota bacterium]
MSEYVYDQAWEHERERLAGLERMADPGTTRLLADLGVGEGWRCLEAGAGGGSITEWLCDRVGASGEVVAIDLDTRFVEKIDRANLTVRRLDLVKDDVEKEAFDLVHSRDVLEHIPERDDVLDSLIAAVKPGGWIMIEDVDFQLPIRATNDSGAWPPEIVEVGAKFWAAMGTFMYSRGVDPEFGRRLPGRFLERGLDEVSAEARTSATRGGTDEYNVARLSIDQLAAALIQTGEVTAEELGRFKSSLDDPNFISFGPTQVATWGRRRRS